LATVTPQGGMDAAKKIALGGVFVMQKLRYEKSSGMMIFRTA
jgi:hypothetical protein